MMAKDNGLVDSEKQRLHLQDHEEKLFTSSEVVRDIIIGVSDGLTVPCALAEGLSGANVSSSIILIAGTAEVAAGAISMELGGYLAAKSEADHYMREQKRVRREADEIAEILVQYGIEPHEYVPVVNVLRRNPEAWVDFMMKFELGLEKPDPMRAILSAVTIAMSYIIGGALPLMPYVMVPVAGQAIVASVVVAIVALLVFEFIKGYFTGDKPFKGAVQTAFIGAMASTAAYSIAKVFKAY